MTTFTQLDQSWIESHADWVDFSDTSDPDPENDTEHKEVNDEPPQSNIEVPPTLSLHLGYYVQIAEKVFNSYLRSFRKYYAGGDISIEKVRSLGSHLRAFLTIVIPSHSQFHDPTQFEARQRIVCLDSVLEEYCEKLNGAEREEWFDNDDDISKVFSSSSGLLGILPNNDRIAPSEPSSIGSRESSVFGDLISEASEKVNNEMGDTKSPLTLSSTSDEQTFCSSSEGSTQISFAMFKVLDDNDLQPKGGSREDDNSFCFSDCYQTDGSVKWESSSISVCGQIGEYEHSEDSGFSRGGSVGEVEFAKGEDLSWDDGTSSCDETRTDFETLMKHWREKETKCIIKPNQIVREPM